MLTLRELLKNRKLVEQSITANVEEIGYLWPFADTDELASSWENTRLNNLFNGSLKGYFVYDGKLDSIINRNDIKNSNLQRGGVATDDLKKTKFVGVVDKMYDEDEVERYIQHYNQPDDEKKYRIKRMSAGSTPNKHAI